MLRRFEIYALDERAAPERVLQFEQALRRCEEFIPELIYSVVGRNLSEVEIQVVWEHGYASPEDYQRYMVHPYHANILDRYLLSDSPERVVGLNPLGDGGLVGYTCDGPVFAMEEGLRQVVLFGLEGPPGQQESFIDTLRALAHSEDGVILSVLEPNTFGPAWFDGVTPIRAPSPWTHVWELGFESAAAYDAYRVGPGAVAQAEARGWAAEGCGVVRRAAALRYAITG